MTNIRKFSKRLNKKTRVKKWKTKKKINVKLLLRNNRTPDRENEGKRRKSPKCTI